MNEQSAVIYVEQLAKSYRSLLWSKRSIDALRGADLQAHRGEIFGLLGPNGAGKTTLVKILLGVIRASSGKASLFGSPAGSLRARNRVGYLPESLRIDRHHTARTALHFYGRMSRMSHAEIHQKLDALLELVGLQNRDRESVRRYSKGMYQRLGLAQALLHDPDLLILDEPTDGLDPVGRNEVRRILLELKSRGKTIFLNSHILQEVELVCDRVAIMARGKVRACGTIDELTRNQAETQQVSMVLTRELSDQRDATTLFNDLTQSLERECLIADQPSSSVPVLSDQIGERLVADSRPSLGRIQWSPLPALPSAISIKATCNRQAAIDAMVDRIRERGLSIVSLQTHRRSLEDVFLELVETKAD